MLKEYSRKRTEKSEEANLLGITYNENHYFSLELLFKTVKDNSFYTMNCRGKISERYNSREELIQSKSKLGQVTFFKIDFDYPTFAKKDMKLYLKEYIENKIKEEIIF